MNKCMDCAKLDVRKNRSENHEYYREYDEVRSKLPHRQENNKKHTTLWKQAFPNRRKAQTALGNAVRDGRVLKEQCYVCGEAKVEGHHPDYDRPLDVVWLCTKHHKLTHAMVLDCKESDIFLT